MKALFAGTMAVILAMTACARTEQQAPVPDDHRLVADAAADQDKAGDNDKTAEQIARWRDILNSAVARHDLNGVLAALDEIIKLNPKDYESYSAKVSVLRMKEDRPAIIKTRRAAAEAIAGSADSLNALAWDLVLEQDLSLRDPGLALKCSEESVRLLERKDAASLDTLARVWYQLGMLEKAMEIQKESLAVAGNADERAQVKVAMDYYEAVLKVRAEAQK